MILKVPKEKESEMISQEVIILLQGGQYSRAEREFGRSTVRTTILYMIEHFMAQDALNAANALNYEDLAQKAGVIVESFDL